MKNKIFIILICIFALFFVGCNEKDNQILYIEMEDEVFINENEEIKVYSNNELVDWKYLDYTISDDSVATIDNGIFKPLGYGEVTIVIISINNPKIYNTKNVKVVSPRVKDIMISGKNEVQVDKKIKIDVKVIPEIITSEVYYKSSNEDIFEVNNGIITGINPGSANLILTCDDFTKEFRITVFPEPTTIIITGDNTLSINEILEFTYNIEEEIVLASSNPDIVKVYDMSVMGLSEGSCTITAYRKDKPSIKGTIELTVKEDSNVGFVSKEEKAKIDSIISKMTIEEMIGQMFMIEFTAERNWYGYSCDIEPKTGLPYIEFGGEKQYLLDYLEDYPIGNFMVGDFNGQDRNNLLLATKTLSNFSYNKTGIMPFIGYNKDKYISCINDIPSNYAISSASNNKSLYDISTLYGKELSAYGINFMLNDYASYNSSYSSMNNVFGLDINNATNTSYILANGLRQNNVLLAPGIDGSVFYKDERSAYDVYNSDYQLIKNNIINGSSIINIPCTVYTDIKDNIPTYLDKEYMVNFLRNELGFKGVLMADSDTVDELINSNVLSYYMVEAIKLGLDLINIQMIFTNNPGRGNYLKQRASTILNLYMNLIENVKNGEIKKERIVEANERILLAKLRNGTLEKNANNPSFDFLNNKEQINDISANFVSVIGDMGVINTDKSCIIISERNTVTGTEKTFGEYCKGYFDSIGYKDFTLYHNHRLDPEEVIERSKRVENVYIAISRSNENTMVGMGKDAYLFELIGDIKKFNPNVCVIVLGNTRIINKLNFVDNFIVSYGYYDDEFNNVIKVLSGECLGNKNYR